MAINHMIKYHVLIPAGVFVVALIVGAPVGTAFVVAMMSGCMSMMLMMGGGGHHHGHHSEHDHRDRGETTDREHT